MQVEKALDRETRSSVFTSAPAKNTHIENTAVGRDTAIIIEICIKSSHCLITNFFLKQKNSSYITTSPSIKFNQCLSLPYTKTFNITHISYTREMYTIYIHI